jgi:hypothetical protein
VRKRPVLYALALILLLFSASVGGVAAKTQPHHTASKGSTLSVPPGWPQTLVIGKIGVRAPIESLDLTKKSEALAPHRWGDVAWYNRSPKPGQVGRASIYGHLDSYCCPAVFWKLDTLRPGDVVQVYYKTGKPITFKVQWGKPFYDTKLPTGFIFARTTTRSLVLMTCAGVFHKKTGYDHRWLVYARAVLPNGKLG